MKNNLFKLGMLIASMGVLVGCGGGNPTSSSSESKASESSSQSTELSSSKEGTTEEGTSEEKSSEEGTSEEEETTEEESTVEEETSEEESSEDESSGEEESSEEEESSGEEETSEEAFTGYSLIGDFDGRGWTNDLDMEYDEVEELYVAEDVTFAIGDNWKIRVDHKWETDYGFGNLVISDDVNLQGCFVQGDGTNISVVKAGTFDIYFDAVESKIYYKGELDESQVEPEHTWGLIGLTGWTLPDDEVAFTKVDDGVYVISQIDLYEGNQFKVVADHSWTINFGYSALSYDADILEGYFHGAQDGNVVVDVDGTFSITLSYFGAGEPANGLYIELF